MSASTVGTHRKFILFIVVGLVAVAIVYLCMRWMSLQAYQGTVPSMTAAEREALAEENERKYEEALLEPWPEGFVPDEAKGGVPYKGMKEIYISNTLLGKADTVTPYSEGKENTYAWFADDKELPDNIVAIVVAKNGTVSSVSINYENVSDEVKAFAEENRYVRPYCTYETFYNMPEIESGSRTYPYTTGGGGSGSGSSSGTSADPHDYDSPDDYADANERRYRSNGSIGAWDDAYDDWLDEVGDYDDGDW